MPKDEDMTMICDVVKKMLYPGSGGQGVRYHEGSGTVSTASK